MDLQGYVGKHPIRAVFGTASGAQYDGHIGEGWAGNYRYTGNSNDVRIEGAKRSGEEPDPYEPDRFGCEFVERAGNKVTGTVEAMCDTTNNGLVIDGTWTDAAGKNDVPFFLGPVGRFDAFDTYYRALLRTPRNVHACAPYVRVDASAPAPGGRELVSYVLRWPCEEKQDPQAPSMLGPMRPPGMAALAAPPTTGRAFIALVDPRLPTMLLGAPLVFGQVAVDVTFSIHAMNPPVGDVRLYKVSAESLSEPGPMAARGGWSRTEGRHWILPVDSKLRLGTMLPLPETYETTGLLCHNESASLDFTLVDLDTKPPPELVVTLRQNEQHDELAPKGSSKDQSVVCVNVPKVSFRAHRLDLDRLRFVSVPAPSEKTLETRPKTQMSVTIFSRNP